MCRIGEPDYGSIINVGKSHLEFLLSVEGVLRAKSELADFLKTQGGQLFVNIGESSLRPLMDHPVRKIILDRNRLPGSEYKVEVVQSVPDIVLRLISASKEQEFLLRSSLWGEHNVQNLIHALGVGAYFGIEMGSMVDALSGYIPSDNRSQIIEWRGHRVYLDAYNANPTSMAHAIRGFRSVNPGKGILILGEMGELGEAAVGEHQSILKLVTELGFEEVYLVGEQFRRSGEKDFPHFHYVTSVKDLLDREWPGDDVMLIKGSRFLALEGLVKE